MTVYELIQKLSRFDSDTPAYIVPVAAIHDGVCKVSDIESTRLADNQSEIVLIQGDDEEYEETMIDVYDRIEHGEFRRSRLEPCTCGGTPEMLYNQCTGKHGVHCPDCGKWEPPIYFSKRDAIRIWNDRMIDSKQED